MKQSLRMLMVFFWVVTPCELVGGYHRFGGTYCLIFRAEDWNSMFLRNVGTVTACTSTRSHNPEASVVSDIFTAARTLNLIQSCLRAAGWLHSVWLTEHTVFSLHCVLALEIVWSAGKSPLIPLERQTCISKVYGMRTKAITEVKLCVTGYWHKKATDMGAMGSFVLNYPEKIYIKTCICCSSG